MRRIKSLGLAVVMALALLAVPAGASAAISGVEADDYPAFVSGLGKGQFTLETNLGTQSCTASNLSPGPMGGPLDQISASVSDTTCSFFGSNPALKMNGCKFIFNFGELSGKAMNGTLDIGPTGCGPITHKYWDCTVSIGSQKGLGATYENVGTGSNATITFKVDATGLKYSETGSFCAEGGTHTNGRYVGTWEVKAVNGAGQPIGMSVAAEIPVGVYVTGKESEEEKDQPQLEAEEYPAAIVGVGESSETRFDVNAGTVHCTEVVFSALAATSVIELPVDATYGGCSAFGFNATVSMNSCNFVFHLLNAGPPYSGAADLVCDEEGDGIEVSTPLCTVTIEPQQGIEGFGIENVGEGNEREIVVDAELEGIEYSEDDHLLEICGEGTFSNGTASLAAEVRRAY